MKLQAILQDWRGDWYNFFRHSFPKIVIVLIGAAILVWLLKAVTKRLVRFAGRTDLPVPIDPHHGHQLRTLASVIYSVGIAVIVFFSAMQILPLLGIDMKPLLASAGIAGLAIGFGAQALVKDVINGFFILVEDQYHLGDVVRAAGVIGTVEDMTLRRTVLRDFDGTLHFVPNSELRVVSNLSRDWSQIFLRVKVSDREDPDRVSALLQQVLGSVRQDQQFKEWFVAEPEVAGIEEFGDGMMQYLVVLKTISGKHFPIARELRRRILRTFEAEHIESGMGRSVVITRQEPSRPES